MWVRVAVSESAERGADDEVPFESCPFPWQTFDANAVNATTALVLVSRPKNSTNSWHSQSTCSSYALDS